MRHAVGIGLLVPVLLVSTGCATKGWVRDLVGKKEAEIDHRIVSVDDRVSGEARRVDAVDGRVAEQATRVEGVGLRVTGLETATGEVGEAARTAQGRADAAAARADDVDGRLTRLWSKRHARNLVDTVHVQFDFDRSHLTDAAQTALTQVVRELKDNPGLSVDLEGYTDPSGPRDYNIQLSQRRVEAVRRYLVAQGIEMPRVHSVGLGPAAERAAPGDRAQMRRVTLKLMVAAE